MPNGGVGRAERLPARVILPGRRGQWHGLPSRGILPAGIGIPGVVSCGQVQPEHEQVGAIGLSCVLCGWILPRRVDCRQSVSRWHAQWLDGKDGAVGLRAVYSWQFCTQLGCLDVFNVSRW